MALPALSPLEAGFANLLRMVGHDLPESVREYPFHPLRKWRFDFAWPEQRLTVELEGGASERRRGRHMRAHGFQRDCEKYNAAVLAGWRVLRYTAADLASRPVQVIEEVRKALNQ